MKKFSRFLSMILAVVMILCATSVVAFAEEPTLVLDSVEFSGFVGDSTMIWSWMSDGSAFASDLVWTSTDDTVATVIGVNEYGYIGSIELVGAGTCTITATYGSYTASLTVSAQSYDPLPFNTELPIADDGSGFMLSFTAPAADYYTFKVTESDCEVYANVGSMAGYAGFGVDAEGNPIYGTLFIEANESVIVSGAAYSMDPNFTGANYKLKVETAPEATGYVLDKSSVTLGFLNTNICDHGIVTLKANPEGAPVPSDIYWKAADDTIVFVDSYMNECYVTPLKVGTTTVGAYKMADDSLIASFPVEVKDSSSDIVAMEWGVLYDFDEAASNLFSFTAKKADTYTLESFLAAEDDGDPFVVVYKKTDGEWAQLDYFDDQMDPNTFMTTSINFKGILEAAAGDEFLFIANNYWESAYPFSIKGTDASNPGYNLKKVAAKPASCTAAGNIEYYECSVTGLKFTDETATRLAGEVEIAKLAHKLDKVAAVAATAEKEGNIAHEKCSVCGTLVLEGKEVKAADVAIAKLDNPATGDNTLLLPFVALVVLSALGLGITAVARKRA